MTLVTTLAYAEGSVSEYVCTHHKGVGFVLNGEDWSETIMRAKNSAKIIVSQNHNETWRMKLSETDKQFRECNVDNSNSEMITCVLDGIDFYFNNNSLRYQVYLRGGYIYGDDSFVRENPGFTPTISIGTCVGIN